MGFSGKDIFGVGYCSFSSGLFLRFSRSYLRFFLRGRLVGRVGGRGVWWFGM